MFSLQMECPDEDDVAIHSSRYKADWFAQFRAVLWRAWLEIMREPTLIRVRLMQVTVRYNSSNQPASNTFRVMSRHNDSTIPLSTLFRGMAPHNDSPTSISTLFRVMVTHNDSTIPVSTLFRGIVRDNNTNASYSDESRPDKWRVLLGTVVCKSYIIIVYFHYMLR